MTGSQRTTGAVQAPADQQSQETADRILETARELLANGGWQALSIGSIAAEAHVYRAAINYHFGGKDALVACLVESAYREAGERVMQKVHQEPTGASRVHDILLYFLHLAGPQNDLLFFEVFGHALREPHMRAQLRQLYDDWTDRLVVALSESTDPSAVARVRPYALVARMLIDGAIVDHLIYPEADNYAVALAAAEEMLTKALAQLDDPRP